MSPNPYEAPAAPLATPSGPGASPARRSRWAALRFLPIAGCGCLINLCLAHGVMQLLLLGYLLLLAGPQGDTARRPGELAVGLAFPLAFSLAAVGVLAIREWHRCRWRQAVGLTLILFALAALADAARDHLMPIRLAPPVAPKHL